MSPEQGRLGAAHSQGGRPARDRRGSRECLHPQPPIFRYGRLVARPRISTAKLLSSHYLVALVASRPGYSGSKQKQASPLPQGPAQCRALFEKENNHSPASLAASLLASSSCKPRGRKHFNPFTNEGTLVSRLEILVSEVKLPGVPSRNALQKVVQPRDRTLLPQSQCHLEMEICLYRACLAQATETMAHPTPGSAGRTSHTAAASDLRGACPAMELLW